MKHLHWAVVRALPLPFAAAFGTLMFLLLMQFLIRYLPELVGRGLPIGALVELVAYSLAYMVTLAVPMSWLIALLTAFGRMSENRSWAVVKSAGVSLPQLAWPALVVGVGLTLGMAYFNNVLLPEANYRMAGLWTDIRLSRPGFELEPGVFYTGLDGYAIRAEHIPPDSSGLLEGVTVFEEEGPQATLVARRARLDVADARLVMTLDDGEVHRRTTPREDSEPERYERLAFRRHRLAFDLSDLGFERRADDGDARGDRTMPSSEMIAIVDSLDAAIAARRDSFHATLTRLGAPHPAPADTAAAFPLVLPDAASPLKPFASVQREDAAPVADTLLRGRHRAALAGLDAAERAVAYDLALDRAQALRAEADAADNNLRWEGQRADRYRVEIYKKNSIALACVVFVLIGVPLGLAVQRGGVGLVATLAVFVFLFYWVTLVQGEKLADRGLLPPWLGMWAANVIIGALGLYLAVREGRDPAGRDPIRRLAGLFQRRR